jgi:TolB-like protein/lipopolysaccharide biosynthesis regulator YciM
LNQAGPAIVRLFREARRRKVFRTGALYVVGAWVALQVADLLFAGYGISNAAIQALVWAAVLGLPVALVFGWLFEITPNGIRRTLPADAETTAPQSLQRTDYLLLAAFAAVALMLLYQAVEDVRRAPADPPTAASVSPREGVARLENSIAVLPFANISSDPDNEYFSDGISEEILNALSGFRQLNVIGRTSSFAFKGSDVGIVEISSVLGVGHVLQGSVRKAGNQLRISAQLLDESGRQVWTETFDRELANVFKIQSEIAAAVAAKVASHVTSSAAAGRQPDLDAYGHFLAGRTLLHTRNREGALSELQRAIDIDPDFAEAHAEWAIGRLIRASPGDIDPARAAIDRALSLQPRLLRAQAAQGLWLLQARPPEPAAAEATLRGVLEQDPNMSDALLWLANALAAQGRDDDALAVLQRAVRIDPLHPSITSNLGSLLISRGKIEEGIQILENAMRQPHPSYGSFVLLRLLHQRAGRLVEQNALAKEQSLRGLDNHYSTALSYALLGDMSAAQSWLDRTLRDFPKFHGNRWAPALVPGWQGRHGEAVQRFREALAANEIDLSHEQNFVQIWYGALLARAGEYTAAIGQLEALVHPAAALLEQTGPEPQLDGPHALAWSYLRSGATAKATALLSGLWQQCQAETSGGRSPDSAILHYCAQTALLRGESDVALDWLERAVAAGWRDYYLRQNDPYWAEVEDDPRFRAQMEIVRKDIDRQRAEVARIDAAEDFIAKVDAAMAARESTTP